MKSLMGKVQRRLKELELKAELKRLNFFLINRYEKFIFDF